MYYILFAGFSFSVKAVLGSGAWVLSSTDGFYLDTTPPVFDEKVLMYVDVKQGEFTPVEAQGSEDTIKSLWLCNDNQSAIQVGLCCVSPYKCPHFMYCLPRSCAWKGRNGVLCLWNGVLLKNQTVWNDGPFFLVMMTPNNGYTFVYCVQGHGM